MKALALLLVLGGVARAEPLALDGTLVADAELDTCVHDGHVVPDDREVELRCTVLASRTSVGRRVRVISMWEPIEDTAFIELATKGDALYLRDTTMRYTPGMGERSSPVQTVRDWSHPPAIDPGTLPDGSPAVVIRIPWTSHDIDRASGRSLGAVEAHAVIVACTIGSTPACSTKIDVDCPAKGCTTQLAHGVLELVTAHGTERRTLTR